MSPRKFSFSIIAICLCLLASASWSAAQTPGFTVNPSAALFAPSPDDAQVVRYELGFFLMGQDGSIAASPIQVIDLGKPGVTDGNAVAPLPSRPVPSARYVAKARAVGATPELISDWSEPSNEFGYSPGAPGKPTVSKR